MENNRKNIYISILFVITVIASCLAVYFGLELKNKKFDNLNNIKNFNTENKVESNKVEEKIIEKSALIDVSKNLADNMYLSKQYLNFKTKIINNKAYVAITDNTLGSMSYEKSINEYYEIKGVNGNVVDICITAIPTSGYPIFVMLMEDGTLQKTKFIQGSDIVCDGIIEGYSNIVRIDDVEVKNINNFGGTDIVNYSKSIVATDKDGNTKKVEDLW